MATEAMTILSTTSSPSLKLRHDCDFVALRSLPQCVRMYHGASVTKLGDNTTINICHRVSCFSEAMSSSIIDQVRVNLTGEETKIVFEKVLTNLARTAPPVPGFRRQKGGKTSKVPKDFLLQMLGEERVTNFVIQEIVSSSLANYAKKENLTVKDNKINTIQTAEELRSLFIPGNEFGFSATLELEISTTETSSSNASES